MKNFFIVVFGGLAAIGGSVLAARGVSALIELAHDRSMATATAAASGLNVKVSGLTSSVRYSAPEEEDVLVAARKSLPRSASTTLSAASFLVKNLDTKIVAAQYASDRLMPIASITKLVTAVVARKKIDPKARITITQKIMSTYGNTAGFKVGETFTASDLMYPLLMVSSNDAAEAFAQYYGRSKFIAAMNDFTQSIGAYRTSFVDPSGLSPDNVSTAADLSIILDWIRKNDPEVIRITEEKTKIVRNHTWTNPTHFLNWANYAGGKNGYTPEANRTAASLFSIGKDLFAIIVLGSQSRDIDEIMLLQKLGL